MDFILKTKKFFFKKFLLARANRRYIGEPALKIALLPMKTGFLLITLSFNDVELIKLQRVSLKNVEDAYDHIVADNSSDEGQAKSIESFCAAQGMGYVRLPQPNPGTQFDRSLSHGFSLNWIFYNVIKKLRPKRFGFFESDVLVAAPGSFLAPWEGKGFWGVKAPTEPATGLWRLWPGFCFFSLEFYRDKGLDFLPAKPIDTGGGNFKFLKDFDTSHLISWESVVEKKVSGDSAENIQMFAGVMHLGGMSFKWKDGNTVSRKWEFAREMVLGDKK